MTASGPRVALVWSSSAARRARCRRGARAIRARGSASGAVDWTGDGGEGSAGGRAVGSGEWLRVNAESSATRRARSARPSSAADRVRLRLPTHRADRITRRGACGLILPAAFADWFAQRVSPAGAGRREPRPTPPREVAVDGASRPAQQHTARVAAAEERERTSPPPTTATHGSARIAASWRARRATRANGDRRAPQLSIAGCQGWRATASVARAARATPNAATDSAAAASRATTAPAPGSPEAPSRTTSTPRDPSQLKPSATSGTRTRTHLEARTAAPATRRGRSPSPLPR
jgi:hypothetical protein